MSEALDNWQWLVSQLGIAQVRFLELSTAEPRPDPPALPSQREAMTELKKFGHVGRSADGWCLCRATEFPALTTIGGLGHVVLDDDTRRDALQQITGENLAFDSLEQLLVDVAYELDQGGKFTKAAICLFGLHTGGRIRSIGDRRRAAAAVFWLSEDSFRRRREKAILNSMAAELLARARLQSVT